MFFMMGGLEEKELLLSAISARDTDLVRDLIGGGVSVNGEFRMPLIEAIKEEHADICDLLLRNGADVNRGGLCGELPLVAAVRTGNTKMMNLLIDAGASVNVDADAGTWKAAKLVYTTPLHVAATQSRIDALNTLLAANSNVNMRNQKHETPLHLAAYSGIITNIQRLVSCGAQLEGVDKLGCTPMHHAVAEGHTDCVQELCKLGASINLPTCGGSTPLMVSIKKGHLGPVKSLLRFGATPDRTETSLDRAAAHVVVEACPHRIGKKKVISINKEIEIMESLAQAGADLNLVDKNLETPLHLCVRIGCPALLEYLIKCEHTITNTKNKDGATPLTTACSMRENNTMIKLLVQYCPLLVSMNDNYFLTQNHPMLLLAERENLPCMRLLLEAGYRCQRMEAESCREQQDTNNNIITFVDEFLLQPWPLLRLCRMTIRELLETQLHRKVYSLPIPQKLRDTILLQDFFVPK